MLGHAGRDKSERWRDEKIRGYRVCRKEERERERVRERHGERERKVECKKERYVCIGKEEERDRVKRQAQTERKTDRKSYRWKQR